ncbi:MAG: hypothetical protein HC790_13815 [Acaryochloridaceae cyanobacterium CSU_3_4]|nr:hypothetical protein [Acaryochloridaceae cyanobacterium CSU_3_4]
MGIIPVIAFFFLVLFLSSEAMASEPPKPEKTDQEKLAELLVKFLDRRDKQ